MYVFLVDVNLSTALRHSSARLPLNAEDDAFGAGAGSLIGGRFAEVEAVQHAAMTCLVPFFDPRRPFHQQQAGRRRPNEARAKREPCASGARARATSVSNVLTAEHFFGSRWERRACQVPVRGRSLRRRGPSFGSIRRG